MGRLSSMTRTVSICSVMASPPGAIKNYNSPTSIPGRLPSNGISVVTAKSINSHLFASFPIRWDTVTHKIFPAGMNQLE
jgi:hypothetical protein